MDDRPLAEAKEAQPARGGALDTDIENRRNLVPRKGSARSPSVQLTTFHGNGLRVGVDLDHTRALHDLMDATDGTTGRGD